MSKKIVYLILLLVAVGKTQVSYKNHRVYNVIPATETEVNVLKKLELVKGIEFWEVDIKENHKNKVMVSPNAIDVFENTLKNTSMSYKIKFEDVQTLIDRQYNPTSRNQNDTFGWDSYKTLEEIYAWLDDLVEQYPNIVTSVTMGQTIEGREIRGVIINYKGTTDNETIVGMIEGTIHAREWISAAVTTWIINDFLTSTDPEVRRMAEDVVWHIFPVTNPDGYVYTFTERRMWRKNRNTASFRSCEASGVEDDLSNGVDLNRNFDFVWMSTTTASDNPCLNTFAGTSPFSEPETRAIADYVLRIKDVGQFMYYFAFHSYTQLVLVPYSHVGSESALEAANYADMYEAGIRGADRAQKRSGSLYSVGLSTNLMYAMSGTSFDWVKYSTDVPMAFLIELRDLGEYGFLLPPEQITPTCLEIMDFLVEVDSTTRKLGYYSGSSGLGSSLKLLGIVFAVFFFWI